MVMLEMMLHCLGSEKVLFTTASTAGDNFNREASSNRAHGCLIMCSEFFRLPLNCLFTFKALTSSRIQRACDEVSCTRVLARRYAKDRK
jgi:hypothetical protein